MRNRCICVSRKPCGSSNMYPSPPFTLLLGARHPTPAQGDLLPSGSRVRSSVVPEYGVRTTTTRIYTGPDTRMRRPATQPSALTISASVLPRSVTGSLLPIRIQVYTSPPLPDDGRTSRPSCNGRIPVARHAMCRSNRSRPKIRRVLAIAHRYSILEPSHSPRSARDDG